MDFAIIFTAALGVVAGSMVSSRAGSINHLETWFDGIRGLLTALIVGTNTTLDLEKQARRVCAEAFFKNPDLLKKAVLLDGKPGVDFKKILRDLSISYYDSAGLVTPREANFEALARIRYFLPIYHEFMWNLTSLCDDLCKKTLSPEAIEQALTSSLVALRSSNAAAEVDDQFLFEWHALALEHLLNGDETLERAHILSEIADKLYAFYQNMGNQDLLTLAQRERKANMLQGEAQTYSQAMLEALDWLHCNGDTSLTYNHAAQINVIHSELVELIERLS